MGSGGSQLLGGRAGRRIGAHQIGDVRAVVHPAHAGSGGDQLGGDRGDIANGGAAVGVADQIDLLGTGGGQQQFDLGEQLLPRCSELAVADT